jgi:hypothetical protein
MLNIIHKPSKRDPSRIFEEISGITPIPKGVQVPAQITKTLRLEYDTWNQDIFNSLPDFIKQKMQGSLEYAALTQPHSRSNGRPYS